MYALIEQNSGGNHGHQIKDVLGGIIISKYFKLTYLHRRNGNYLDFTGLQHVYKAYDKNILKGYRTIEFTGPEWRGYNNYFKFLIRYRKLLYKSRRRYAFFSNACRVHPFQIYNWQKKGIVKNDIYGSLIQKLATGFKIQNPNRPIEFDVDLINVAVHISRGVDYKKQQKNSKVLRYMFSVEYFKSIIKQIENSYSAKKVLFHIYTEKLNSEEVVKSFSDKFNVKIHLGENRDEFSELQVANIFNAFVKADVLVTCNSSFSVVASYFRNNKPTIYYPHRHLDFLNHPAFLAT
ncbi:MAG: hypothetical protein ACPGLV_04645, partial [Bacteroidia bacterium]